MSGIRSTKWSYTAVLMGMVVAVTMLPWDSSLGTVTVGAVVHGAVSPETDAGAVAMPGGEAAPGQATGPADTFDPASTSTGSAPATTAIPLGGGATSSGAPTSSSPASTTPSGSTAPTGTTGTSGTSASQVVNGPGATADTITIGIIVGQNTEDDATAVGIDEGASSDGGDTMAGYEALREWINANGGVGGRNIEYVTQVADLRTSTTESEQRMCAAFVDDQDVFAVVLVGMIRESTRLCYAERGRIAVDPTNFGMSEQLYAMTDGYVWAPAQAGLETSIRALLPSLARRGFFDLGIAERVGVAYYDFPTFENVLNDVWLPTFEEATGIPASEVITSPIDASDAGTMQGGLGRAVGTFRGLNVTKVLFIGGAPLSAFFSIVAEGNGYRPNYGVTSVDNPLYLERQDRSLGFSQAAGTMGIGSNPYIDVAEDGDDLGPVNATSQACLDVHLQAGFEYSARYDTTGAMQKCEALLFVKKVGDLIGPGSLTPDTFREAATRLGNAFQAPQTWQTLLRPGLYNGGSAFRELEHDASCACMRYVSPVTPFQR